MSSREVKPLHQYESFRILVLRVIESFVYKSLDETISLLKITTVINNNPLIQLVRTQISPGKTVDTLPKVTIRDVILSITKIFQSSDIQILANNDNFKIKLSREAFQGLIDKHYGRYQENAIDSIKDDEEDYGKIMKELAMIEKGELDQLVVEEFKQTLQARSNTNNNNSNNNSNNNISIQRDSPPIQQQKTSVSPQLRESNNGLAEKPKSVQSDVEVAKVNMKSTVPPQGPPAPVKPVQPAQSDQPSQPIQPSQPPQPSQPLQSLQSLQPPQSSQQSPPVTSSQPAQEVQQAPKLSETSQPSKATQSVDQIVPAPSVPTLQRSKEAPQPAEQQDSKPDPKNVQEHNIPRGDETKTPTPEATTPPPIESEIPEHIAKEDEKSQDNEKETTSELKAKDETDKRETTEENAEEKLQVEEIKKEDIEHEEKVQTAKSSDKKRHINKEEDKAETPAKKKAKLSASSVPSSPAGPVHAPPNKKLQILSNPLIANITSYKYASTFLQPVSENNAPDYYSLIKEPRDLKTIKAMVKDGRIQNAAELERDILLMFANAIMYNKTDSDIYNWSKEMQVETDKLLQLFKESYDTT